MNSFPWVYISAFSSPNLIDWLIYFLIFWCLSCTLESSPTHILMVSFYCGLHYRMRKSPCQAYWLITCEERVLPKACFHHPTSPLFPENKPLVWSKPFFYCSRVFLFLFFLEKHNCSEMTESRKCLCLTCHYIELFPIAALFLQLPSSNLRMNYLLSLGINLCFRKVSPPGNSATEAPPHTHTTAARSLQTESKQQQRYGMLLWQTIQQPKEHAAATHSL